MQSLSDVKLEAYRLSERRIEVQTQAALAADQRAMSAAGLALAAAAIMCGLAKDAAFPFGMLAASLLLMGTVGLAGYSARPVDFHMAGSTFGAFARDIADARPVIDVIVEMAEFNDEAIEENNKILGKNATLMTWAYVFALLSLVVAVSSQIGAEIASLT